MESRTRESSQSASARTNSDAATPLLGNRGAHHESHGSISIKQKLLNLNSNLYSYWNSLSKATKTLYSFLFVFYLVLAALFWLTGPERVFDYTAKLSLLLSRVKYGKPLLALLVVLVSFPPIPGYSSLMSLCGLAFGSVKAKTELYPNGHSVLEGWILAMSSTILGASISFLTIRFLLNNGLGRGIMRNVRGDQNWKAMEKAVERKGLIMIIVLRFCPFPFVYSNLFFASMSSVTFFQFLFSTMLITPKLFLHVFVGSRLFELMDRESRVHLDPRTKRMNFLYAGGGILIGAITGWVLWRETKKVLMELQEQEGRQEGQEHEQADVESTAGNEGPEEPRGSRVEPKKVSHKNRRRDRTISLGEEEEGTSGGEGKGKERAKGTA